VQQLVRKISHLIYLEGVLLCCRDPADGSARAGSGTAPPTLTLG
jgi:hypothetical protein